jgi:hypothetical protein
MMLMPVDNEGFHAINRGTIVYDPFVYLGLLAGQTERGARFRARETLKRLADDILPDFFGAGIAE